MPKKSTGSKGKTPGSSRSIDTSSEPTASESAGAAPAPGRAPGRPFGLVRPRDPKTGLSGLSYQSLIQPRILLVTAHPGNELLFAPTILSLLSIEKRKDNRLWALCLSTGDYDESVEHSETARPLGEIRREEWDASWGVLGLPEDRRWILDVPGLKDNRSASWDPSAVAKQVEPYVLQQDINTILTFDNEGVSHHPNQGSIPSGISHMLASPAFISKLKGKLAPRLFTLKSVPARSQHGPLSPIMAHLSLSIRELLREWRAERSGKMRAADRSAGAAAAGPKSTVFISDVKRYVQAWKALRRHHTQWSWTQVALATSGKYLWVNEWVEEIAN